MMNVSEKSSTFSGNKYKLITLLNEAHRQGEIELPFHLLAEKLELTPDELKQEITELIDIGLVDRSESNEGASLSATGLKAAKKLSENKESEISGLIDDKKNILSNEISISGKVSTHISWERISLLFENWPRVVNSSSLNAAERKKLLKLGDQFFNHPATAELLRRAMNLVVETKN